MIQNQTQMGIKVTSDRRWALIHNNVVDMVILWDGNTQTYQPPLEAIELPVDSRVGPGWTLVDEVFIEPEPTTQDPE